MSLKPIVRFFALLAFVTFALTSVAHAAAPAAPRNLLGNPGFERGFPAHDWMPAVWDTSLAEIPTVFFGRDSLSRPRAARPPVDLSLGEARGEADPDAAREEIRRRNLNVLTPQRAARFVERHLPEKGARISTETLHLLREDDLLDLLAALSFDRGPSSVGSRRSIRWRVHAVRADFGTEPDRIPRDAESGRLMERFTLERLA